MAGHSKWANIQHRKGAQDAKRAKIFNKLSKEIMVSVAKSGPDATSNASLRLAVSKAKAASMPKKNIEAAINKASGNKSGATFQEVAYGANLYGVALLIECLTDNQNRVAASVQYYLNRAGGDVLGASSVSYIFDRKGLLEVGKTLVDEEALMLLALDLGANDFEVSESSFLIYTEPSLFSKVKEGLEKNGYEQFLSAEVRYFANQEVVLPKDKAESFLELIDKLEDDEDIQNVYHNLDANSLD